MQTRNRILQTWSSILSKLHMLCNVSIRLILPGNVYTTTIIIIIIKIIVIDGRHHEGDGSSWVEEISRKCKSRQCRMINGRMSDERYSYKVGLGGWQYAIWWKPQGYRLGEENKDLREIQPAQELGIIPLFWLQLPFLSPSSLGKGGLGERERQRELRRV